MLFFIANQLFGKTIASGGDVLFCEIAKRVRGGKVILCPGMSIPTLRCYIGAASFFSSDSGSLTLSASTTIGGLLALMVYLRRAVRSYLWLTKNVKDGDTVYLTGDFICNSLPAYLVKLRHRGIRVLANFYHRNPLPEKRPGNPWIISYGSRLLQTISLHLIKKSSSVVFVLSKSGKDELAKLGISREKIVISGAGVDLSYRNKYKNSRRRPGQLVFVGRINVTKGVFELMNILGVVARQPLEFTCKIIGTGTRSEIERLNYLMKKNKIENRVKLMGFVDESEKHKIIAQSSALLLPSKEEGFGIVVLEALSHETSVICYDLPVLRELFSENENVKFVKNGRPELFASELSRFLRRKDVSPVRRKLDRRILSWEGVHKIQSRFF